MKEQWVLAANTPNTGITDVTLCTNKARKTRVDLHERMYTFPKYDLSKIPRILDDMDEKFNHNVLNEFEVVYLLH